MSAPGVALPGVSSAFVNSMAGGAEDVVVLVFGSIFTPCLARHTKVLSFAMSLRGIATSYGGKALATPYYETFTFTREAATGGRTLGIPVVATKVTFSAFTVSGGTTTLTGPSIRAMASFATVICTVFLSGMSQDEKIKIWARSTTCTPAGSKGESVSEAP